MVNLVFFLVEIDDFGVMFLNFLFELGDLLGLKFILFFANGELELCFITLLPEITIGNNEFLDLFFF